ncbi:MAG: SpoVG family protein [Candidatus Eisenbacteria bacterium]
MADNRAPEIGVVITEVRVSPKRQGRLRALCSVTFGGVFVVRGIKVIEGPDRLFLAMPSRKEADGKYRDVCHPVATGFRNVLEKRVIDEYLKKMKEQELAQDGRAAML